MAVNTCKYMVPLYPRLVDSLGTDRIGADYSYAMGTFSVSLELRWEMTHMSTTWVYGKGACTLPDFNSWFTSRKL